MRNKTTGATLKHYIQQTTTKEAMKTLVLVLAAVAVATSKPAGDEDVVNSVIGVVKSCSEEDVGLCLKVCVIVLWRTQVI